MVSKTSQSQIDRLVPKKVPKHSVLEQIWIKGFYLDQSLSQHESLYPIGLKPARIEMDAVKGGPKGGSKYVNF